jgi:hypothetical protein
MTKMIRIKKSPTADTRTCDWSKVTKEQLLDSSLSHKEDVTQGLRFLAGELFAAAEKHDHDKVSPDGLAAFHADFVTGFEQTTWWDNHRKVNRHHLLQDDGVPADVNLIDVLDMVVDCVMAGMARSGSVYPLQISDKVLRDAFNNTVDMLKSQVQVAE